MVNRISTYRDLIKDLNKSLHEIDQSINKLRTILEEKNLNGPDLKAYAGLSFGAGRVLGRIDAYEQAIALEVAISRKEAEDLSKKLILPDNVIPFRKQGSNS